MRYPFSYLADESRYTPTMAKMWFPSQAARRGGKIRPLTSSTMNE
ncbi:MAG: hypothetical protein H6Q44_421 [Deltaproteobacteria bacterium]|nr:hypothetical protein [Deltaproteobacteria bacterium]